MDRNLLEEQRADYRVYVVEGSHYEIGRQTALQSESALSTGIVLTPEQRAYAEACRTLLSKVFPELIDEFSGYAETHGMREDDLLWHYTLGVTGGCSSVAVATKKGMITGRNYDFFYWENRRHLIFTRPDLGFAHIGMHDGLIGGRFDGLNEKGLFVSFNGAGEHPNPARVGLGFHLVVRYLLEKCETAIQAKDALMEIPLKEPKSYMVADNDHAFVVEAHPERRRYREMSDTGVLVMTNHYVHPDMSELAEAWPNSLRRYDKLQRSAGLLTASDSDTADLWRNLQSTLADHEAPLCGHDDGLATFWSCTAELRQKRIMYCLGAPCRNAFTEYFRFSM
ncbi:MAG: C45 family peptidase [Alicyclobacillus macrosporangiidus]|uniref:C45 family autoproteolytic acyltransferase/hydolase n=1 Tax=Alicyclobacillus macrosporangiidus TaxID=392015 RepID=UPI0026EC85D4|nr:C45 family peptidase [Alicyclobacillus macrosporangiidus]MCL6600334.1 C45 family peptidase [Alicyclobacillus macrosporangiidus]